MLSGRSIRSAKPSSAFSWNALFQSRAETLIGLLEVFGMERPNEPDVMRLLLLSLNDCSPNTSFQMGSSDIFGRSAMDVMIQRDFERMRRRLSIRVRTAAFH